MAIGKQKARERVGFEPTVRLPVQRFSSSKSSCWFAGQHGRISVDRKASGMRMIAKWNREIEKCTRGPWPFWPDTS